MYNTQTSIENSKLLQNKLAKLVIDLQQKATPNGNIIEFNSYEKIISEAFKILSHFYKTLSEPSYQPKTVLADTIPDAKEYNDNFQTILDDLQICFSEFENLEDLILGNFNFMVSRLNRLNHKLKLSNSNLADYILLADLPLKDSIFFSDSFSNLNRIENNSTLLTSTQCEINQAEGIATLPIDKAKQKVISISNTPVINSNSNGINGNNEENNAPFNGDISSILDGNADTWFEYEKVSITNDNVPLLLDLTIKLNKIEIINFIRINPNNFGTSTQIEIIDIQTSNNGKDFISIKDDIPINGFDTEDEENIFILAPNTSKFAGQGLYTFTPRSINFVRLILKQSSAYEITTSSGIKKLRYAIGIRDVEISALPYQKTGELISTNYTLSEEIKKIALISNQNPVASSLSNLVSIEHYVSPNNGISWHQIRAKTTSGESNTQQSIPEILNFNGVSTDSIITDIPVKTLRYKAKLIRNTEAFTENTSELAQEIEAKTELHTLPTTTPFLLSLQNVPIKNSIKVIDPQFGSRGKEENKYQIAIGNGSKLKINLPFKPLKREFQKTLSNSVYSLVDLDPQNIYVNNIEWTRGALSGTNKNYKLNFEEGTLEFGDGSSGKEVASGSVIAMNMNEERLYVERGDQNIAKLAYPTSHDKKQVELYFVDKETTITSVLRKGQTRHQLNPDITGSYSNSSLSITPTYGTEVLFVDGSSELSTSQYSIDYTNGVLYLKEPTSTSTDVTVQYKYTPRTLLAEDEWDFIDSNTGIANSINIKTSSLKTHLAPSITIPTGVKYFNLSTLSVVRGTLAFANDTTGIFSKEVSYINGHDELLDVIKTVEEIAPITTASNGSVVIIPLALKISTNTNFGVTFSNTEIFKVNNGNIPTGGDDVGDYYVEIDGTGGGRIHLRINTNTSDPGTVSYFYIKPSSSLTGCYSVNYETGEVYCYEATTANITVQHEYTDYRIKYDIARLIDSKDWTYNESKKQITINDREILKNIRTPQSSGNTNSKYYQISYNYIKSSRENISALEPYFSPVLKDYAIRVITKSRLV